MAPNLFRKPPTESASTAAWLVWPLLNVVLGVGAALRRAVEKPVRRLGEKVLDLALDDPAKSTTGRLTPIVPSSSADVATYRDPLGPGVYQTAPPARVTGW
jgi:hypothetical protein